MIILPRFGGGFPLDGNPLEFLSFPYRGAVVWVPGFRVSCSNNPTLPGMGPTANTRPEMNV